MSEQPYALLTPEEVADALHIGRTRVYAMLGAGELPSVKIGRSRRVTRQALARFVERLAAGVSGEGE